MLFADVVYYQVKRAMKITPKQLDNAKMVISNVKNRHNAVLVRHRLAVVYQDYGQLKRLVTLSQKETDDDKRILLLHEVSDQTLIYMNDLTKLAQSYVGAVHEDINKD